jgi:uncharacterized cupredoxin-like copper-binding protein
VTLNPRPRQAVPAVLALVIATLVLGCEAGPAEPTPPIVAGTSGAPREVNLITRDYKFVPDALDLVPGETILLHVINGGLIVHEAVIGDASVQEAWEVAEAATAGAPPGPTPVVSVPPEVSGIRVVVQSGERVDVTWTVPADAASTSGASGTSGISGTSGVGVAWFVGCHIPGHWAKGMQAAVRWVLPPPAVAPAATPQ